MKILVIKKNRFIPLVLLLVSLSIILYLIFYNIPYTCLLSYDDPSVDMKAKIEEIYNTRSRALVSGDMSALPQLFFLERKYGKWSLEHEVRRVKYLEEWSKARGIKIINIESFVRIRRTYKRGELLKFSLEESYKFDYIYKNDPTPSVNSFGVGIRHTLSLINKNDKWLIYSDWYTDCFEDAMGAYSGQIVTPPAIETTPSAVEFKNDNEVFNSGDMTAYSSYNREKAAQYADKYCGAAWGSGNNFKYNKKYSDYNGLGGDCTNYVSQALSDSEGGGLKQNGGWYPGARSWSNVNGLKDYIIYSGRGYVISKGTYEELTKSTEKYPKGIISRIMIGDLICYVKKGDPDHFGIVTGFDTRGYPLINSHTTDRYHVPWDLGWGNKNIKFILIHMNG